MNNLNPQQRAAITHINSHLLVLAGAGSGKTRVITEKIIHLIGKHGVSPKSIIAVTFTNKAANEMKARIAAAAADQASLVDKKSLKGLSISTFHTLGLNILRREFKQLGLKKNFTIFDSADSQSILRELLLHESDYAGDEVKACWAISRLKNDLLTPKQALIQASNADELALATLYGQYQKQLSAYNGIDFDDLILQPTNLFKTQPEILEKWQSKIAYLLVDEYQDTNPCQYELVRLLLGEQAKLTAVGDDDQSIYAWRGAQPENLHKLTEDFPDLKVIKLEQNYRSMGRILKCANELISQNPHVFDKNLWSELGYGDPLRVLACKTPEDEAERVASEILHKKFQNRCKNEDFAILYRGNYQSRPFENVLRLHNLPYKVSGGTAFFDRTEIKDILAYLRLIVNENDDAAFLRIVNTPRREIGANTLEKLGNVARDLDISLLNSCRHFELQNHIGQAALTRIQRFSDWINEKHLAIRETSVIELVKSIVDEIHYSDWLLNTCSDKKTAENRMENVNELIDWVGNMSKKSEDTLLLDDLVNKLSLMDIIERNETQKESDSIQLMTMHAAKGLEFPHVFIIGMEEGLLPHQNSKTEEAIEEERRLAYVGITRAQRSLTFTFAEIRKKAGETVVCESSRFLEELPEDELEWEGKQPLSKDEKMDRGNANLNSLRKMLGTQ